MGCWSSCGRRSTQAMVGSRCDRYAAADKKVAQPGELTLFAIQGQPLGPVLYVLIRLLPCVLPKSRPRPTLLRYNSCTVAQTSGQS